MRHHVNFYVNRLVTEWLKNGKIIIGCDVDDTIISRNEEQKENCSEVVSLILECQKEGIVFLINTARDKNQLKKTKEEIEKLGIEVHGVNQMHPKWDKPFGVNGKIYANIYLDDRGGLDDSCWILETAYHIVRNIRKENK